MSISLYSAGTIDTLLAAKLSISSLSNAATSTLNATAPTAGQALTFDGTDLVWATVGGGGGGWTPGSSDLAMGGYAITNASALTLTYGGGGGITFQDGSIQYHAAGSHDLDMNGYSISNAGAGQFSTGVTSQGSGGISTLGGYSGNLVSVSDYTNTTTITPTGIQFPDSTMQTTAATFDQKRAIANSIASCFSANTYSPFFQFVGHVALVTYMTGKYNGSGSYLIGIGYPGSTPTSISLTSSSDSSGNVIATVSFGWTSISGMAIAYSEDGGTTWTYSDLVF
jgi:hypothetical protein